MKYCDSALRLVSLKIDIEIFNFLKIHSIWSLWKIGIEKYCFVEKSLQFSNVCNKFYYRNAKPLVPTSGYWAESLPAIDSPLCAVIDPLRDFRWHALRCGGPETAAFLCELSGKFSCGQNDLENIHLGLWRKRTPSLIYINIYVY